MTNEELYNELKKLQELGAFYGTQVAPIQQFREQVRSATIDECKGVIRSKADESVEAQYRAKCASELSALINYQAAYKDCISFLDTLKSKEVSND